LNIKEKILSFSFLTIAVSTILISTLTYFTFLGLFKEVKTRKIYIINRNISNMLKREINTSGRLLNYLNTIYSNSSEYLQEFGVTPTKEAKKTYLINSMNDIANIEGSISFLAFGTSSGKMILDNSTKNLKLPKNYKANLQPWFVEACNTQGTHLSKVFLHSETKTPTVTLSQAIRDNDEIIGVLLAKVDFSYIKSLLSNYSVGDVGDEGSIFIVDENYRILADGGNNNENLKYLSEYNLFSTPKKTITVKTDSGERFFYVTSLYDYGISIITTVEKKDLYKNLTKLRYVISLIVVLTLGFFFLFLHKINKTFNSSLDRISHIIRKIADGSYAKNSSNLNNLIKSAPDMEDLLSSLKVMNDAIIKRENKLKYLSEIDALTNAYNRRMIFEILETLVEESKANKMPISIIMFDLDKFKSLNDTYGHIFGDTVLKKVSKVISESIRPTDVLGRYGGEEFILVLPNTKLSDAIRLANRLRKLVERLEWEYGNAVTVSLGVIQLFEDENIDIGLERADNLLYKAKKNGRNRVEAQKITTRIFYDKKD
jgi:diguanylate cyclase (GGDEF)-like protein